MSGKIGIALLSILGAATAGAAFAQATQTAGQAGQITGACGQPEALTYTLPLPLDTRTAAPLDVTIRRAEPAYLEFTLTAETRVVLRTGKDDSEVDPYLALLSSSGAVLGEDDDTAADYNALLDLNLPAGTYCAQIRPYAAVTDTELRMELRIATGAEATALAELPPETVSGGADFSQLCGDPSMTVEVPDALAPGLGERSLAAQVPQGGRQDWRFTVAEALAFQADATSTDFDTTLTLAGEAGELVAENDDGDNMGTDSRIAVNLEPGTYCLSLAGFDGSGGQASVDLTDTPEFPIIGDVSTACSDPSLTASFGAPLAPGLGLSEVRGTLAQGLRSDWLLEVAEEAQYQFDLTSDAFDPVLTVLDSEGGMIETNDDGPVSTDSRIVVTLAPGQYCLAAEALGGGTGDFGLSATDEPDPAPVDHSGVAPCTAPDLTADIGAPLAPGFGAIGIDASVADGSRRDWSMTVTEPVTLRVDARSGEFDTMLRLAEASGANVAENDDAPDGSTDSQIDIALAPGSYCLILEGFAGAGGAAEVALTEIGEAEAARMAVEGGSAIPAPDSGIGIEDLGALDTTLQSSAPSPERTKWLAFSTADGGAVTVNAVSASGDFMLRLFTEAGDLVGEAAGAGGFSPTALTQDLEPGRYLIGMTLEPGAQSQLRNVMITRN